MKTTAMKTYSHTFWLAFILVASGITINAQINKTIHSSLTDEQLKGIANQSDKPQRIALPKNNVAVRAIKFIDHSRQKHTADFSPKISLNINAAPSDSAYVYEWDTNWDLKYRIYYIFDALSIEILQEIRNPDDTWSNYSQRILEYYNTGYFRRETQSFWKSTVSDWKIAYFTEYNTEGRITEEYSRNWNDTTQEFTEGYRIVSTYKKDTLLETELYQEWDVAAKAWTNLVRIEQSFDANDLISNMLQTVWKENAWENDYSIDYIFNEFGDLSSETAQEWDTLGLSWINDVQILREYNSLGNITNVLRKKWDSGTSAWVNEINQIFNYNAFFQPSSNLIQNWNGSTWIDTLRSTYTYTGEGDISSYLEEAWSGSAWQNLYREIHTYGAAEVTIKIENWNSDGSTWVNDVLITYLLDDLGYIMIEKHEFWNTTSSSYETGYYDEYDLDGYNIEYYQKTWNDTINEFTGGLRVLNTYTVDTKDIEQRIIQEWDTVASEWENYQKTNYYWSDWTAIDQIDQSEWYKIYPMPFSSMLNVELKDEAETLVMMRILGLNGLIIGEAELSGRITTIDLSYLNKGIYFAEIYTKSGKSVVKIIKN